MMRRWIGVLSIPVILVLTLALSGCTCPKKQAPAEVMPTTQVVAPAEVREVPPPPEVVKESSLEEQAHQQGALLPIYFDYDKSSIKAEAKANLDKTAAWLGKNAAVKVRIEGNCDERGTAEYNLALGERRANGAKKYLVNSGVKADRLSTISYGKEKPICAEHNEACWSKNRRDDFKVLE
jgi:peptidoglycan-associated lipoprotein